MECHVDGCGSFCILAVSRQCRSKRACRQFGKHEINNRSRSPKSSGQGCFVVAVLSGELSESQTDVDMGIHSTGNDILASCIQAFARI